MGLSEEEARLIIGARHEWGDILRSHDPLTWAVETARIELPKSGALEFSDHPFLIAPYRDIHRECVFLKGAQLGFSTLAIIRTLWATTTFPLSAIYCFDEQTEILTRRGWTAREQVLEGEDLLTFDTTTAALRWSPCLEVFQRPYVGPMVWMHNSRFDALVTPDHWWAVKPVHGIRYRFQRTSELSAHQLIPIAADSGHTGGAELTDDQIRLLAWTITEGSYRNHTTVVITQNHGAHANEIRDLLRRSGVRGRHDRPVAEVSDDRRVQFVISGSTARWLQATLPTKELTPDLVQNMSISQLHVLIETMLDGDGDRSGREMFHQKSKRTSDAFAMAVVLTGRGASIRERERAPFRWYETYIRRGRYASTNKVRRDTVAYAGWVWCPRTRDRTVVARRNGKIYISGQTFPNADDVSRFTASRIDPMIASSEYLKSRILNADSVRMKQFSLDPVQRVPGERRTRAPRVSTIYFNGAQTEKDATAIDADLLVHDEEDRANAQVIEQYESRLDASLYKWKIRLSTPTIPGTGIDSAYRSSDQRVWMIRCPHCPNAFEFDFPANIEPDTLEEVERGTPARYICDRCKGTITDEDRRTRGLWVPTHADARDRAHGYAVSQMAAPRIPAERILERRAKATWEADFWNLVMGRAWTDSTNEITREMMLARTDPWRPMETSGMGTFMGVDVGTQFDIVIDAIENGMARTIHIERSPQDWTHLDHLLQQFGVINCVIDALPEEHATRKWAEAHPGIVWRAQYAMPHRGQTREVKWDEEKRVVTLPRDETLTASANELTTVRVLPKYDRSPAWEAYLRHHENSKRIPVYKEGIEAGDRQIERYSWVNTGPDHLFHAATYAMAARWGRPPMVALPRVGLVSMSRDPNRRPISLSLQGPQSAPGINIRRRG